MDSMRWDNAKTASQPFLQALPQALEIAGFTFAYPDCEPVLRGVDLCLPQGSFTMLVGATGSGKTTLLRCLKPELAPAGECSGKAEAFGVDLLSVKPEQTAPQIGYVAQSPENQIVCDSVWHELAFGLENMGMPQEAMRRRVAEVANFFGIEPWFRRDTDSLSGGQKQVLNLASVLAMQPRLLLLDEPTAQLDPVASKNFLHALFRINRELGITVLVATHAPEGMVDYATGCMRIEEGHVYPVELEAFRPPRHEAQVVEPCSAALQAEEARTALDPQQSAWKAEAQQVVDSSAAATVLMSDTKPMPMSNTKALSIRGVFFRYSRGAPWVLRGASLQVGEGSIHALVGGNGSGKTTVLKLLAGALKPERGKVLNPCLHMQALLPQDPKALFVCDTLVEELCEWSERCGYTEADALKALSEIGLDELGEHHPYDISGGQQQKLALAKLLLTKPRLLFLDEPTKGLDASSRVELAKMLSGLREQGVTMLLVTHDMTFASRIADTISMLFDGEVTCTEPVEIGRAHV